MTRLGGPNFTQIPINAPRCPMQNFQRDGFHQMHVPKGRVNYSPNSQSDSPHENSTLGFRSASVREEGDKLRARSKTFADHFSQARQFFYSQTEVEQQHIIAAFTFELSKVMSKPIRARMLGQLANVDPKIAQRVAKGLGSRGPIEAVATTVAARADLKPSRALSILANAKPTLEGRVVGLLVADGTNPAFVAAVRAATKKAGAALKVVAPTIEGVLGSDGKVIEADLQLAGGPSVLFDTVLIAVESDAAQMLALQPAAVGFVQDAFSHLKVIGHVRASEALLQKAGVIADDGIVALTDATAPDSYLARAAAGRVWAREPKLRPAL